jgi:hypothetical protein
MMCEATESDDDPIYANKRGRTQLRLRIPEGKEEYVPYNPQLLKFQYHGFRSDGTSVIWINGSWQSGISPG